MYGLGKASCAVAVVWADLDARSALVAMMDKYKNAHKYLAPHVSRVARWWSGAASSSCRGGENTASAVSRKVVNPTKYFPTVHLILNTAILRDHVAYPSHIRQTDPRSSRTQVRRNRVLAEAYFLVTSSKSESQRRALDEYDIAQVDRHVGSW
jgi:hypothetical protein